MDYPGWTYDAWDIGKEDMLMSSFPKSRLEYHEASKLTAAITEGYKSMIGLADRFYLRFIVSLVFIFFEVFILIREFVLTIKKKTNPCIMFLALSLLAQAAGIALVMPAAAFIYFHAYFCCTFVLDILYFGVLVKKDKKEN
jgi:hypothetical protein